MPEPSKRVGRSSSTRWWRRFWWRVLVVAALLISPALIVVFVREDRLTLPVAAAVLAIIPAWLLDGVVGPPRATSKPPVAQRPRTLLWLMTFVALMLAIHLPDAFTAYLKLEQDRACLRAAAIWVTQERRAAPERAEKTCDFAITPRSDRP